MVDRTEPGAGKVLSGNWRTKMGTIEEIDAGHDVMLSKPEELAALLTKGRKYTAEQ